MAPLLNRIIFVFFCLCLTSAWAFVPPQQSTMYRTTTTSSSSEMKLMPSTNLFESSFETSNVECGGFDCLFYCELCQSGGWGLNKNEWMNEKRMHAIFWWGVWENEYCGCFSGWWIDERRRKMFGRGARRRKSFWWCVCDERVVRYEGFI